MGLLLTVVVDAHKKEVAGVLRHFGGILATENLVDGGVGIAVVFQLQDDGGRIDILSWNEHEVGESLARWQFAMDDIVIAGVEIGNGEYASQ